MENIALYSFLIFAGASLALTSERSRMRSKKMADWITDIASLLMHFIAIPILQISIVHGLLGAVVPQWKGILPSSVWLSVLLYLLLDYMWYWNHRILHAQTPLWNLHKTHHSPDYIDVFVTSRNALITHFLMIYFWFIGAATFLLSDARIFLGFATFGMLINFWGHTSFSLPCNLWVNKVITAVIVTPREHLWHHSRENPHCNFGTVLIFWDRIHGTAYCKTEHPTSFGDPDKKSVWTQLIWPF